MAAQWKGSTNILWLLSQAGLPFFLLGFRIIHSAHANNSSSGDPLSGNTASCDSAFSNLAFGDPVSDNPAPRNPASCDSAFGNFASNNLAFGGSVSGSPGFMARQPWASVANKRNSESVIAFSREGFFRNHKLR
ncbi:hypothetical protein P8452_06645 [Trifolium repens]|nr:hypothetical protein P8452_06645 [Trifolium repens]